MAVKTSDEKIRLWTRQHSEVLKKLKKDGVYRVKERDIRRKLDTCADIYLNVYKWLNNQAGKRMEIDERSNYPVWFSTDRELTLPMSEGFVFFELEIPSEQVLIFDMLKWDYIVNYLYLPKNKEDRKRFKEKLDKYGISVESDIYLENFYPLLKKEMVKSWERLFDNNIRLSDDDIAVSWKIEEKWVVNYEEHKE